MSSQIHLVRHAESIHNVTKDFSLLDPPLTSLGHQQAEELGHKFPHSSRISIIIVSPLRRAIETALSAFPHVLDKQYFDPSSNHGVSGGAKIFLDADIQERSDLPCDTGSPNDILERDFPRLDTALLGDGWQIKEGLYSPDDAAVEERAKRARQRLKGLSEAVRLSQKNDIVVVTHGIFMKFLSGEPDIDLPKAGWKTYTTDLNATGRSILVPVRDVLS
jgi:broad specificity phosphatase PhoE